MLLISYLMLIIGSGGLSGSLVIILQNEFWFKTPFDNRMGLAFIISLIMFLVGWMSVP